MHLISEILLVVQVLCGLWVLVFGQRPLIEIVKKLPNLRIHINFSALRNPTNILLLLIAILLIVNDLSLWNVINLRWGQSEPTPTAVVNTPIPFPTPTATMTPTEVPTSTPSTIPTSVGTSCQLTGNNVCNLNAPLNCQSSNCYPLQIAILSVAFSFDSNIDVLINMTNKGSSSNVCTTFSIPDLHSRQIDTLYEAAQENPYAYYGSDPMGPINRGDTVQEHIYFDHIYHSLPITGKFDLIIRVYPGSCTGTIPGPNNYIGSFTVS